MSIAAQIAKKIANMWSEKICGHHACYSPDARERKTMQNESHP
jgi:hypothetical protein